MSERARLSLRAGPVAIKAQVAMTPAGLVATGALVASVLLATSVLVRVAVREGRRTQQGPPLGGSDGPSVPDTLRGESG